MNYMRLVKVLYFADRESMKTTGHPITGDAVIAMKRGPVLSRLLDLIKDVDIRSPQWQEYVRREGYKVRLARDPGNDRLSRFELQLLERIAQEHETEDEWEMVQSTHTLPEWLRNDPGESSKPIPYEHILEAVGRQADVGSISEEAEADFMFSKIFGE
jgi:uncharacterized phage-associated protein